jgi:hypothetical protein
MIAPPLSRREENRSEQDIGCRLDTVVINAA